VTGHVVDRLSAYLDNELDGLERGRVDKHLGDCAACARHLEELLTVDEAARRLELSEPPEGYFETLPGRLRERLRVEARPRRRYVLPAWTWAAAAAVLVAVIAPVLLVPSLLRARIAPPPTTAPEVVAPAEPGTAADRVAEQARAKDKAEGGAAGVGEAFARAAPTATSVPPAAAGPAPPGQLAPAPAAGEPARAAAAPSEIETSRPAALGAGVAAAPAAVAERRADTADLERTRLTAHVTSTETKPQTLEEKAISSEPAEGRPAAAPAPRKTAEAVHKSGGALPGASETAAFDALLGRSTGTAAEARALREAWREFAAAHPDSRRADEARVRVVETGLLAFQLGGDPADRERARADAGSYLVRPDAAQADRVRGLLASLER